MNDRTDAPALEEPTVTLPLSDVRALLRVYEVVWNQIGFVDPGKEALAMGVVCGLDLEDSNAIDEACVEVEARAVRIMAAVDGSAPNER